jgi:hypothetical protein
MTKPNNDEKLVKLLRDALPPVECTEPERDLWPLVLRRMDAKPAAPPWYDWALGGALAVFLALAPKAIPMLLYYL